MAESVPVERCEAVGMQLPPLDLEFPDPVMATSADGTPIATYDLGGTGEDMLLVHATGFCAAVWGPLASRLPDHRRVALDVRGHGRSGVPENGMDWQGTAEDVLATIDVLGLERPFGVGHSMGGASLLLAEQARPGTFRGMWLFEPIVFPPQLDQPTVRNPLADGARRRRAHFADEESAYRNFATKAPLSELAPAALGAYVRYGFEKLDDGSVTLRCRPEVEAQTYEMGPRHDAFEHLSGVRCPVTVARGADDGPGPAALAPLVAGGVADGRLVEHPELGHFGPLQDPAAMAMEVGSAVGVRS